LSKSLHEKYLNTIAKTEPPSGCSPTEVESKASTVAQVVHPTENWLQDHALTQFCESPDTAGKMSFVPNNRNRLSSVQLMSWIAYLPTSEPGSIQI
jgi:hypothetical protein